MTKTNIEKLTGLQEKAYELSRTNPSKIALAYKQNFAEDLRKLKASDAYRDLNTGGRVKAEEKLRADTAKHLFKLVAEQKAEYTKVYAEANTLAKTIQTTEHEKPKDALAVKLFEQELESLKTATMLGSNAQRSIEAIDGFIGKYDDPYFASVIKQNFTQLSQNVLSIESSMQNRATLSKVLARVDSKAMNDEQKAATETLGYFGDGNPKFFIPELPQYNAIAQIVGKGTARFLDNPSEWLEAQEQAEQVAE